MPHRPSPWPLLALLALLLLVVAGCTTTPLEDPDGTGATPPHAGAPPPAPPRAPPPHQPGIVHWRGDLGLSGYVPNVTVPDAVELAWRLGGFNKGDHTAAKGSAVLVDDTLLVGADTGTLYRLTLDGSVLWAAATWPSGFGIHGTPAAAYGLAFIGAYDGAMYAFDLDTGALVWRTPIGGSIGSSPIVHADKVYVSVETPRPSGILAVLNATTGELLFTDPDIGDHPHSTVALDPALDRIVVGANDGVLYAWTLSTLERAWTYPTGGAIKGPILLHDGVVYAGSWDDSFYAVDAVTGQRLWSHETDDKIMGGAGYDPTTDTVFVGGMDDVVYAFEPRTGDVRWSTKLGGTIIASPTIAGDKLLVGAYDEKLYALDTRTGEVVWRFDTNGRVTSSALVWDGGIAVLDRAAETTGSLWVLAPAR